MAQKGQNQTKPTPSVPIQPTAQKPSFQPPAQPTRNPPQPAAPPPQPRVGPPGGGIGPAQPPPQNNVMQPPRSSTTNPPLQSQLMRPGPAASAKAAASGGPLPSTTNCDISNTTDNTAMFQMPNHQQPLRPQPQQSRGRSPGMMQPQQAMFQVTSHVQSRPQGYQTSQNPKMIGRLGFEQLLF